MCATVCLIIAVMIWKCCIAIDVRQITTNTPRIYKKHPPTYSLYEWNGNKNRWDDTMWIPWSSGDVLKFPDNSKIVFNGGAGAARWKYHPYQDRATNIGDANAAQQKVNVDRELQAECAKLKDDQQAILWRGDNKVGVITKLGASPPKAGHVDYGFDDLDYYGQTYDDELYDDYRQLIYLKGYVAGYKASQHQKYHGPKALLRRKHRN